MNPVKGKRDRTRLSPSHLELSASHELLLVLNKKSFMSWRFSSRHPLLADYFIFDFRMSLSYSFGGKWRFITCMKCKFLYKFVGTFKTWNWCKAQLCYKYIYNWVLIIVLIIKTSGKICTTFTWINVTVCYSWMFYFCLGNMRLEANENWYFSNAILFLHPFKNNTNWLWTDLLFHSLMTVTPALLLTGPEWSRLEGGGQVHPAGSQLDIDLWPLWVQSTLTGSCPLYWSSWTCKLKTAAAAAASRLPAVKFIP